VSTTDERAGLSIAEAAERLGLSTHALRYYETEGLLVGTPARTSAGRRRYEEADLRWIVMVQRLRATGMPVREVREYAELCRAGAGNEQARLQVLRAHRERVLSQLEVVTNHLGAITAKIDLYEAGPSTAPADPSSLRPPG
jgi:DNA-binding transcriptional MerR regulator